MKEKKHELTQFFTNLEAQAENSRTHLPSQSAVHKFVDELFALLFHTQSNSKDGRLRSAAQRADALMTQLATFAQLLVDDSADVATQFFANLPTLHTQLTEDAEATLALDPAATSLAEVIATYPGFYATALYRMAHQLDYLSVPILPRMVTEYAHGKTGIDIHPSAQIGRSFVIDHGTGVVIGATARIGNHVTLYHGVTLGALQVKKSLAQTKRHPTIEDHVTIYANATILGGKTVVGSHSVIGGNAWVTRSVSPHSLVYFNDGATVEKSPLASHSQAEKASQEPNSISQLIEQCQKSLSLLLNQIRRTGLLDGLSASSQSTSH